MKNLDWTEIIENLERLATSLRAKKVLHETKECASELQAEQQLDEIGNSLELLSTGIRPHMESLDAYALWWERIRKNAVLKTLELRDVRKFCHEVLALKEALSELHGPWAQSLKLNLMDAEKPLSAIDQLMSPQGEIRVDASERLFQLYQEKTQLARSIQSQLDKLVKSYDLESVLQDRYVTNREGRWVLPIRSGSQHQFPGIVHASSHSKQTVFMEPEQIVPMNNRLSQIDSEIEQEIERLLIQISSYLSSLTQDFAASETLLLSADVRLAQGQLAQQLGAQRPIFQDNHILLKNLRHPLLSLQKTTVVPNTVELDTGKRILLLSGPNAGGKTVLLKAIGLAAQMARCGLFICADNNSHLPFFKRVLSAVGDSQSVDNHLSTFAAHVTLLNQGLALRGPKDLLLVDEICGSTDPEEGTALARSFIESYAEHQVFGVITSHLGPLKMGWENDSGVVNGSMEYDTRGDRPTYRFLLGIPGDSLALQTAQRVGVDTKVLERAYNLLTPETRKLFDNVREVENLKSQLTGLQEDYKRKLQESDQKSRDLESTKQQFENQKAKWFSEFMETTEKRVQEMIEQAKVQQIFKKFEVMTQIKQSFPEVVKPSSAQAAFTNILSVEDFTKAFPPGSVVHVPSLGQDGVVQGTPNGKGEVPVLSQSLRVVVLWSDLKAPKQMKNPTAGLLRKTSVSVSPAQDFEASVDVRGLRVDEAIAKLEMVLDDSVRLGQDRVKIVHGHGTEVLKKSIRAHLSRSPYVRVWQAGNDDGVTWAELND